MNAPWNLTFDEYKAARIEESGVGAEDFCEAYSDAHLTNEYLSVIADPPRDADLDLRIYDTLSTGMQKRWRKFSFTLDAKLIARTEAEYTAARAPYVQAETYVRRKIVALEGIKRTETEYTRLERLRSLELRLKAPFATDAEKDVIVTKLKRFADYA